LFPLIVEKVSFRMEKFHSEGYSLVGYDAALICEMGHHDFYRPLIVVQCRELTQIGRLMKRHALPETEAMRRISAQMPMEQKVALADYVINTDGSIEESVQQTKDIIETLRRLYT